MSLLADTELTTLMSATKHQPDPGKGGQDGFFLPDFCAGNSVFVLVLVTELFVVATVLAASGLIGFSWQYLALVSLLVQWVTLTSAYLICKLRQWLAEQVLATAVTIIFALVLLVTLLLSGLAQWLMAGAQWDYWPGVDAMALLRNSLVSVIMTGMVLRYFYVQAQLRRQEQAELEARIRALQARIRPHFLFNSMNSIASLIETDPQTAERVVEDLSELFRASLSDQNLVPLSEEIELSQRFMGIEQLRLGPRLEVNWQLGEWPQDVLIPQLSLQPLLENAIYHGVQPLAEGGQVDVSVYVEADELVIRVLNPYEPDLQRTVPQGHHMALSNIRDRLQAHFGDRANLTHGAINQGQEQGSYQVEMKYPLPTEN